ncbi:transcription factor MYB1R1-like [Canna indica]|uniref:Transcription factor MYB1R1-like n=1 Tax=Canna indica TaxID=4628 RepID=A0AAQ3K523_9LILI|nr:transcription factor MYB1R1-like [Canna indica]
MTRRCSHCSNNGHNSRTCPARGGGVRLFGVRLTDGAGAMKKSASMGCLSSAADLSNAGASPSADPAGDHPVAAADAMSGYASDDPAHASSSSICRKKGVPWTEDEHRMFLLGLQKLGKGDWRGIARNYVVSRTPTQVASHAQKYFIRQSNASRRKRRSSLFDMPIDQIPAHDEHLMPHSPSNELEIVNHSATLHLNEQQGPDFLEASATRYAPENREMISPNTNPIAMVPAFYPAFIPVPLPFWSPNLPPIAKDKDTMESHPILKPIPVVPKEALNVEEVVGISKLRIGDGIEGRSDPAAALSLKLVGSSTPRPSAFHVNSSVALPDLNQSNSSPIHAV